MKTLNPTEVELAAIQARIAKRSKVTAVRGVLNEKPAGRGPGAKKYYNEETVVDGIAFESKREAKRYGELKLLELAKDITDLRRQVEFACVVDGLLICKYFADFAYKAKRGERVVEDAKGIRTEGYKLKKKLVKACFGVEIVEV